jgi:hypothetical protein
MARLVYLTLAVAVTMAISASAQTDGQASARVQSTSGAVKAVGDWSLTVQRSGNEITFSLDRSTRVLARGRNGTGPRDLVLRTPPTPGRSLADFVKAGDPVAVRYRQSGNAMIAVEVRVVYK